VPPGMTRPHPRVIMCGTWERGRSSRDGVSVPWSRTHSPTARARVKASRGVLRRSSGKICISARRPKRQACAQAVPPGRGAVRHAAVATVPRHSRGEILVPPGQRQSSARRSAPRKQRRVNQRDDAISVLARTVREVEAAVQRGRVTPAVRAKFQAAALLLRDERARVREAAGSENHRAGQLKRLDGEQPFWRPPLSRTPGYWRCSPTAPTSPTRPGRLSGR
jgi:hypothetical protein